ncbi:putative transcription factor bZIP family [Dioscorea sansibarensis]
MKQWNRENDKKKMSMGNEMGANSSSSSVNQEKGKGLSVPPPPPPPPPPTIGQHPLDPKKLRRLMNNRESSLRMRMRKEQRLMDMEQDVQSYTDQVNTLPLGIENTKNKNELLRKENNDLKTKIFTLISNNRESKEVEEIMMKKDIEELNQLHSSQIDMFLQQEQQQQFDQQKSNP